MSIVRGFLSSFWLDISWVSPGCRPVWRIILSASWEFDDTEMLYFVNVHEFSVPVEVSCP